jgi:DNA-binding transcriptional MocR family regulator
VADPLTKVLFQAAVGELQAGDSVKLTGWALSTFMDRYGYAWPSLVAIARRAGRSVRTVRRALRELERAGLLTAEQRHGKPALYLATPDTQVSGVAEDTPVTAVTGGADTAVSRTPDTQVSAEGVRRVQEGVARATPAPPGWVPEDDAEIRAVMAQREAARAAREDQDRGEGWADPERVANAREALHHAANLGIGYREGGA